MDVKRPVYLVLGLAMLAGCQHFGYHAKRQSELNCPTDIRQSVPWCAGEDAVFQCPCGPASEFHGYKPTCWGVWPAPGAEWRDAYCGPLATDYACRNGGCQSAGCPCASCPSESRPCEITDAGLVRLPPLSPEPPIGNSGEEIQLGKPTESKVELGPRQVDGEPVPVIKSRGDSHGEPSSQAPSQDRSNPSAHRDYTLPHELQALRMQSVLNSPDGTNLETASNSAAHESCLQQATPDGQLQVADDAVTSRLEAMVDPNVSKVSAANRRPPRRTKTIAAQPSNLLETRTARTAATRTAVAKQKLESQAASVEYNPQTTPHFMGSLLMRLTPEFVR